MKIKQSNRVKSVPPYMFAEINRKIADAKKKGVDVISLGIGDPDMPTPAPVVEELARAAKDPKNHQYPDYEGMFAFRDAVSKWYKRRHGVILDPDKEVLTLIGGKEGNLHISLALTNPGDYCLIPVPGYTPYRTSTVFCGGIPHEMPLLEKNNFLPELSKIPGKIAKKSRIIFVNYPNNPTGAVAELSFYKELIDFAEDNNIVACSDNPYSEIGYEGYKPLSFLEVPGAKEIGVELNSLSKPYNMTGWRIGMAVGNEEVVKAMGTIKNNTDSGVFNAVQLAAIKAMELPDSFIEKQMSIYQKRRDLVHKTLTGAGLSCTKPKAALYMWAKVPEGHTSASFATEMLEKAGVVITPGAGYGKDGEGYFRISLTVPDKRLGEAMERIKRALR
ncbi:LL-diaminopimelate aminotransferase [Candidatus Woesearchaeota archaeon]|nr:LL-diaminopimelate aminotransferase [Candidatus Woesearchaeota archaeon]